MLHREQLRLFEERLASVGVGRRDFLRMLAGMTAAGSMFLTTSVPTVRAAAAPGERLAKVQVLRRGDFNDEPASFDVNKDLYCNCEFGVFAGLTGCIQQRRLGLDVPPAERCQMVQR